MVKTIMVRFDDGLFDSVHKLMGYQIGSDGIIVYRVHHGSNQDFYRKLLQLGLAIVKEEYEKELKKYGKNKDDN